MSSFLVLTSDYMVSVYLRNKISLANKNINIECWSYLIIEGRPASTFRHYSVGEDALYSGVLASSQIVL